MMQMEGAPGAEIWKKPISRPQSSRYNVWHMHVVEYIVYF